MSCTFHCSTYGTLPTNGRHSCKMFIKSKPIRFGYKAWVLANEHGYPFKIDLYQGAEKGRTEGTLGSRVVLQLIDIIDDYSCHQLYFDNFFCSYDILNKLQTMGLRATGTIRSNRTGKCPLISEKEMSKQERGHTYCFNNSKIQIVQWYDNRMVLIGSNFDCVSPKNNVQRYDKKTQAVITVKQPNVIKNYNSFMGGVDLLDNALANLRPTTKCKKWYFSIVVNCFRILMVASWKFHVSLGHSLTQLQFVRDVVHEIIKDTATSEYCYERPGPSSKRYFLSADTNHVLEPSNKQGRCRQCKKNSKMQCKGCKVNLHINCFELFHKSL